MILILKFLITNLFLKRLEFLDFSNSESSPVWTIPLEVRISMAFEALLSLQLF